MHHDALDGGTVFMSEFAIGLGLVAATTGVIGAGVSYGTHYLEGLFNKGDLAKEEPLVLPQPENSIREPELLETA